jgi:hypothetical protein
VALAWGAVAVVLVQAFYWPGRKLLPPSIGGHPFCGHVVLFLGRISFVFVSSMFVLVFFNRIHDQAFTVHGLCLLAAVLFSVFCYALELERLGRALVGHGSS